jgi:hypothetical protein
MRPEVIRQPVEYNRAIAYYFEDRRRYGYGIYDGRGSAFGSRELSCTQCQQEYVAGMEIQFLNAWKQQVEIVPALFTSVFSRKNQKSGVCK